MVGAGQGQARPAAGAREAAARCHKCGAEVPQLPLRGFALIHQTVQRNRQLAAKVAQKTPAHPLLVQAQPLRVALQFICSPGRDRVQAATNRCMWIMSWTSTLMHVGKPALTADTGLPSGSVPVAWLGLRPGETAFSAGAWAAWHQRDSSRWWCVLLCPRTQKHFYYQAQSVWRLNICCSLLMAADRGIIGGLQFTTFIFIYICVSNRVAICQIWKCLIGSDGQIN